MFENLFALMNKIPLGFEIESFLKLSSIMNLEHFRYQIDN